MDYNDYSRQLERLLKENDAAMLELKRNGIEHAQADSDYRAAKSKAYLLHVTDGEKRTVTHLEALVDRDCKRERDRERLAKSERETSIEYVRSLRTSITALQTLLNHSRAEIEMSGLQQPRWSTNAQPQ